MLADVRDYDEAMKRIAGGEELVPAEVVYALLDGGNPIRVWREFRGLSQGELATKAGISASYLSQLESGKRDGTVDWPISARGGRWTYCSLFCHDRSHAY